MNRPFEISSWPSLDLFSHGVLCDDYAPPLRLVVKPLHGEPSVSVASAPRPFAGEVSDWLKSLPKPPISTRKVGGLRFIKVGRFCVSYCITKEYKPL